MSWFSKLFKNTKQLLQDETIGFETIRVAIKQEFYHEIVGNTVRIYERKGGLVEEVESEKPYDKALSLLKFYNKGDK